jgi:DNA-binding winged helix-turn-helix (wHTH) protein/Tol biopolymer transport system component
MASPVAAFVFGPFRLDLASMQLLREGEPVPLTPKVFDTLVVLLQYRGRVVGKDELVRHVWGETVVSEDSLSQSISILRRALGDDRNHAEYIATVARRGYRFIAPVREIPEDPASAEVTPLSPPPPRARPYGIATMLGLALATGIVGILVGSRLFPVPRSAGEATPFRFTLEAPAGTTLRSGAVLAPDNRHLMFVAADDGGTSAIWVRPVDGTESRRLPGTDDASRPFWSPDGQAIGFFAAGLLKRTGLDDGAPQTLTSVGLTPGGGAWSPADEILFAGWRSGLSVISATGGAPRVVTTLDAEAGERAHARPQFLPDGRHFLFYVDAVDPTRRGTYVASIEMPDRVKLLDIGGVTFITPSHLAYVRDGALVMHPFDTEARVLRGEPWVLASNVVPPLGEGTISGSPSGLLAFGGGASASRLAWYARDGTLIEALDAPRPLHNPAFTRDGRQLLASDGRDLWSVDVARNAPARLGGGGSSPFPSPDGTALVFTSDRDGGVSQIYHRRAGSSADAVLLATPENKIVNDWTRDGRFLVYVTTSPRTSKDIWLLPMQGEEQRPVPYLVTPFNDIQAQVSPDGRWLAYASDESGRWEVYVQSFPDPGHKRVVSVGGGASPQWRNDGRELYYLSASRRIMAVDLDLTGAGRMGAPKALFPVSVRGQLNSFRSHFVAAPGGDRFLVDTIAPERRNPVTFLVNWQER